MLHSVNYITVVYKSIYMPSRSSVYLSGGYIAYSNTAKTKTTKPFRINYVTIVSTNLMSRICYYPLLICYIPFLFSYVRDVSNKPQQPYEFVPVMHAKVKSVTCT
jgi:hypothetical protein